MSFDIIVAIVGPLTSPSLMAKDEAGGGAAVRECESASAMQWCGMASVRDKNALQCHRRRFERLKDASSAAAPSPSFTDGQTAAAAAARQRGR